MLYGKGIRRTGTKRSGRGVVMDLRDVEILENRIRKAFVENDCKGVTEILNEKDTRIVLAALQDEIKKLRGMK
jgi:hypothetical protein